VTVEEAKAELHSIVTAFFVEVSKLMDAGESYELAVMDVCKARPDLLDRETHLRDYIKGLGRAAQEIGVAEIQASAARRTGAGATYVISLASNGGKSGRIPIAQLGVRYKGKQKIEITPAMLADVVTNFRKRDTGEVPIDYDHAIETAAGSGEPVPAAGWIRAIDDAPDGQGILWGTVQWTTRAAGMIRTGEYKYVSPVIDPSVRDNKTGEAQGWTLTSAALTNQPVLQGMPALVLSDAGWAGEARGETQVNNDEVSRFQTEIDRRTRQMMAANPRLGYQGAFNAVMQADPKLADERWNAVQVTITTRVKELMANNTQLTYRAALTHVLIADSNLAREYREARTGLYHVSSRPVDDQIGVDISAAVAEKLAASEGKLDYSSGLKLVLRERPELARRYKATMR